MSQDDIYVCLKNKRLSGNDSYFSAKEIMRMLNGKGIEVNLASVNNNLLKLRTFGFLDMRIDAKKENRVTYPFSVYRLKKEYLE
jgi:Fe2+ or Zn2+ uptake regulation protein